MTDAYKPETPRGSVAVQEPGQRQPLHISFRHTNEKNERSMIKFKVPDEFIGNLLFEYFQRMGVPVKLVQNTTHGDVERILREGNVEKS